MEINWVKLGMKGEVVEDEEEPVEFDEAMENV
jgi:hypothetical protein